MSRTLMLCALLVIGVSQAVAAPFNETVGGWTVFSLGRSCTALNRDVEEFNMAPYNALVMARASGSSDVLPRLYVWPGALAHGAAVRLSFGLPGVNKPISVTAVTADDYVVSADAPLSPQELDLIGAAGLVTVQVSGSPEPLKPLAFRTEGLPAALEALGRCATGT